MLTEERITIEMKYEYWECLFGGKAARQTNDTYTGEKMKKYGERSAK